MPRPRALLPAGAAVLLFLLLNIEIADFYATGPEVVFRFGASIAQDLTYTIGWLVFGLGMLACGIALRNRAARIASLALVTLTTCKCFLYDLGSLGGLYRIGAFVGLACSLALVSIALQKYSAVAGAPGPFMKAGNGPPSGLRLRPASPGRRSGLVALRPSTHARGCLSDKETTR